MFKYRLIYSVTLFAVFTFYILYSPWFSFYLLVLVLALIPFDLLISLPCMRSRSIIITVPPVLNKDASGELSIQTVFARDEPASPFLKSFSVKHLYVKLLITEGSFSSRMKLLCPADVSESINTAVDTSRCGLIVYTVRKLYAVSQLGLFSLRIRSDAGASVLVLPVPSKPEKMPDLPRHLAMRPKPGGGFSEEHEVRGYVPGDPVNAIHWKLSAKYDSIMIREPFIPIQTSRLIHIIPSDNAQEHESVLAHLLWVSDYLLGKGLTYYAKLGENPLIMEIANSDDLVCFLRKALDRSRNNANMRTVRITRFAWVYVIDR